MEETERKGERAPRSLATLRRRIRELEELKSGQRCMESALRDSEQRYRFLHEENPSMYFTVDTVGTVLSVNPFGAQQLGYAVADLMGQPVLHVFHPEDRDSVKDHLQTCVDNPRTVFNWEFRKVRKNGEVMWVREVARAVQDRNDRTVVLIVCEDITSRKKAEDELRRARDEMEQSVAERTVELRQSQQELQLLAGRLLTAQEDERRRLAREMHDDLTQRLAGLAMQTARLSRFLPPQSQDAGKMVRDIHAALTQLSTDVHALSRRVHSSILEDLGLVDAITAECAAHSQQGTIEARFRASDVPTEIDRNTAMCLYRITQEALRNVAKHAKTNAARVFLSGTDGSLTLAIEDDGVGFDVGRVRGIGLGLSSMEERARLIRAEFVVESRPGGGSVVRVRVPGDHSAARD